MVLFKTEETARAASEVQLAAEVMLKSGIDPRLTESINLVVQALLARALGNISGSVEINGAWRGEAGRSVGAATPGGHVSRAGEVALRFDRNGFPHAPSNCFSNRWRSIAEILALDRWWADRSRSMRSFSIGITALTRRRNSSPPPLRFSKLASPAIARTLPISAKRSASTSLCAATTRRPRRSATNPLAPLLCCNPSLDRATCGRRLPCSAAPRRCPATAKLMSGRAASLSTRSTIRPIWS